MKIYKYLIIGLVTLISFTLFFNYPGFAAFELYTALLNDPLILRYWPNLVLFEIIFRYTLGISALFTLLSQAFPLDNNIFFLPPTRLDCG